MTTEVIIISEETDETTNHVIQYLNYFGCKNYVRLNAEEVVRIESIEISAGNTNIIINYRNRSIFFNTSKVIWYRRGNMGFQHKVWIPDDPTLNNQLNGFLTQEWIKLRDFILSMTPYSGSVLGNIQDEIHCNKLENLVLAGKTGFNIPDTIITSSREKLVDFLTAKKKLITKPVSNIPTFKYKNVNWSNNGNSIVTTGDIENLNTHFSPLLVQEYIEKEFEIRVFFFGEKMFPMAIFSQNDERTSTDYRNYNFSKPNRVVPMNLPDTFKQKIKLLVRELNVFSGSIDLIQNPTGEIYFLEVNYFGQLDWLSHHCNYYIEQQTAEYLLSCTYQTPYLRQ